MSTIHKLFSILIVFICAGSIVPIHSQVLEAAYCEWDDQFDEWKLHVNEDEYVMAVRQFGANEYRRWSLKFENVEGEYFTGFMQLKRAGDINYWDFEFDNEHLSISTIYRNDIFVWKVQHDEQSFSFVAKDRFGYEWEDRYEKNFDWKMYQVQEGDLRNWYIDDLSEEELNLPMRLAAAMVIIELSANELRR